MATRHSASVANLRDAAAQIDTANEDLAAAANLIAEFSAAADRNSAKADTLDESVIDPLLTSEAVQAAIESVGELTDARKVAVNAVNRATESALANLDATESTRGRLLAALDGLLNAIGYVNDRSGEHLLAVTLHEPNPAEAAELLAFGETPSPGEVRAALMKAMSAGTLPSLRLEEHEFGTWLAFGNTARRGQVLDAILEVCKAAKNARHAAGGFRKSTRALSRMAEAADELNEVPAATLLEAWHAAGECIMAEARRQLDDLAAAEAAPDG